MAPESEGGGGSCGAGLQLLLGMLSDQGFRGDGASAYSGALDRLRAAVGGRLGFNTLGILCEPRAESEVIAGPFRVHDSDCSCAAMPTEKGDRLLESECSGGFENGSELKQASSTRPPSSARSTRASSGRADGRGRAMQRDGHCGRRVHRHWGVEPRRCSGLRSCGLRLRPRLRFRRGRVRRTVTRRTRRWRLHCGRHAGTLRRDFADGGFGFRAGVFSCASGSRTPEPMHSWWIVPISRFRATFLVASALQDVRLNLVPITVLLLLVVEVFRKGRANPPVMRSWWAMLTRATFLATFVIRDASSSLVRLRGRLRLRTQMAGQDLSAVLSRRSCHAFPSE